jgi:hypothetical protein
MNILQLYFRTKLKSDALKLLVKQVVLVFNHFWPHNYTQVHRNSYEYS